MTLTSRALISRFLGAHVSDRVARAQIEALKQRVPYLYAILIVNNVALACTHLSTHEVLRSIVIPVLLVTGLLVRTTYWLKLQPDRMTDAEIRTARHRTVCLAGIIGVLILGWAMSLHGGYAEGASSREIMADSHVDFFAGITVISCIFLLMHLREAAFVVAITIIFPFTVCMLMTGQVIAAAIAINLILVTAAMLYVAVSFARDFERMITNAADLERLSALNAHLAVSDSLTGLPNRRRFFQDLEHARLPSQSFAVVVLDLDGFKHVNDVYGHKAGDEVLVAVSERLRQLVPSDCLIARLGGDEFAALLCGAHAADAEAIAAAFIAACSVPIVCRSLTANIGASAGVCSSDAAYGDPIGIYERADYALFEAKHGGRGRLERFNAAHDASMKRASRIGHLLRSADLGQELTTSFQPVLAAKGHEITSFEALVRWNSAELGLVGPGEFIPIAERTDLIFEVSRNVLRTALGHAAHWPRRVSVKINLSVRDLMSQPQTEALLAELHRSAVEPSRVTFEVTETIFADSLDQVRANIDLLRAAGCAIAIDDFGVGYSSLNYIHALAPDIIKIDCCFVAAVDHCERTRRIIRTIVELARNVGARSVAEGVETAEQAQRLAELGCDELQGFYFSPPLAPAAAAAMAAADAPFARAPARTAVWAT